ncbi:MAG: DUF4350 domain-containing protein [Micrococcales bacterium]|nr:DUF4350 domain-containing protein [Micrococcales bacterium]
MSATYAPPTTMVGDGTSGASRARSRWRRARGWVVVGAVVLVGVVVMVLPQPATSGKPYATDNPGQDGARALARILERQGVRITVVDSASQALAQARAGDTLAVVGDRLTSAEARQLAGTEADLVAVDVGWTLEDLVPGVYSAGGDLFAEPRQARCDDPDARVAGTVTAQSSVQVRDSTLDATLCFPDRYGEGGAYVTFVRDGRRTTVLADGETVVNSDLAQHGNAALALRSLGRNGHLVWYVPTWSAEATKDLGLTDVLPPALPVVGLQMLVLFVVAALWRGRRLGPVVAEPLPVVVPAAEASRGRARLYRKMGARERAAAALRGGSALRLGTRLGLPRSAPATELVDATARASGRPAAAVESLLYGPPPTDDRGLVWLAQELDRLESEVHHP